MSVTQKNKRGSCLKEKENCKATERDRERDKRQIERE